MVEDGVVDGGIWMVDGGWRMVGWWMGDGGVVPHGAGCYNERFDVQNNITSHPCYVGGLCRSVVERSVVVDLLYGCGCGDSVVVVKLLLVLML